MNKKIYLFFIILLILLVIPLNVFAAPPFSTTTTTTPGLQVEANILDTIKINNSFEFNIHVFNATSGMLINTGTSCTLNLYNSTGGHITTMTVGTVDKANDYDFLINENNFTEKSFYFANFNCNQTAIGGAKAFQFQATQSGQDNQNGFLGGSAILIFSLALAGILFAYMGSVLENKPSKVLFFGLAAGLGLALIGTNYTIIETLSNGGSTSIIQSAVNAGFYPTLAVVLLFIVYTFLSIFYNLFKPKSDRELEQEERESSEEGIK